MHLTREVMYDRIGEFIEKEPDGGDVLTISGSGAIWNMLNKKDCSLTEVNYPEVDIQSLPYKEQFDYIITDQIIEHVRDPFKAVREAYKALKRGGIAIFTTCFMNEIHYMSAEDYQKDVDDFTDYWRFTPQGLKVLFEDFSKIEQCEGWGTRKAHIMIFQDPRARFSLAPKGITNENEKKYPISTWIIARK